MTTEEQELQNQKNQTNLQNKGLKNFARYSGMAFQMLGIILVTTWGGVKLDKLTGWKTPVFTVILSLFGVLAAMFVVIRDVTKR